jgi:hypothetical protein
MPRSLKVAEPFPVPVPAPCYCLPCNRSPLPVTVYLAAGPLLPVTGYLLPATCHLLPETVGAEGHQGSSRASLRPVGGCVGVCVCGGVKWPGPPPRRVAPSPAGVGVGVMIPGRGLVEHGTNTRLIPNRIKLRVCLEEASRRVGEINSVKINLIFLSKNILIFPCGFSRLNRFSF